MLSLVKRRGATSAICVISLLAALLLGIAQPVAAQQKFPMATFTFPSIANVIADVMMAKGFDKSNGLQIEPVVYGTGGALWAGIAKGEVFAHTIGPYQMQKLRSEGIPMGLYGTLESMASLQIITTDPQLKSFADLRGRTFAGTVAFAEFEYIEIYAKRLGLNLRKDVNIIDATTATAQAQLAASRVDAILSWEPAATLTLQKIPGSRVLISGDEAWRKVTGHQGWQLLLVANLDYVKQHPGTLPRLLKAYQDFGNFLNNNPDEADAIVSSNKYVSRNVPPGIIAAGIKAKRLVMDVQPSWDPEVNKQIWQILQIGYDDGHMPAMPAREAGVAEIPR